MPDSSTDALVDFATSPWAPLPPDPIARTLVDTIGVALPGFDTDVLAVLTNWAKASPVDGPATVWGEADDSSAARAALLNGTAAHALDFDDAAPSMPMHPSAVLWPALLAWSDAHGGDGARLSRAFSVGQAAFRAIGEALPMDDHYPRGWHSTATIGRLAAVSALVSLAGMAPDQARHALGIAATMASGSIANFGTMTKPLHAGLAAHDAVIAAEWAIAGLTAHGSQLDHPKGFFSLFGSSSRSRADLPERLDWWRTEWVNDLSVKQYPSCYGTHRAVDAALDSRSSLGDDPGDFARIEITVHPSGLDPLIDHLPTSGLEAKFSLPYTVVRALTDGRLDLGSFADEVAVDPAVVERMSRVTVATAPAPEDRPDLSGEPYSDVRIAKLDGTVIRRVIAVTRGDARNPLTDEQIDAKFLACAAAAGWAAQDAQTLLACLRILPTSPDVVEVTGALRRTVRTLDSAGSRSEGVVR